MESIETKIPQFFDLLEEELISLDEIFSLFFNYFHQKGYRRIETSAVESRERYISSTKIHSTKIFEVRRPKEGSIFSLQSDLAMSMSRFIADNADYSNVLKFIQFGNLFRDRVDKSPGYRRQFKQILIGAWGSSNSFYDEEVLTGTVYLLRSIEYAKISYIQISNQNIFNCISEGLAEKVRFGNIDMVQSMISSHEYELLRELYIQDKFTFEEFQQILSKYENCVYFEELKKTIILAGKLREEWNIKEEIIFSFKNLDGTNHYSGMNYRVYMYINDQNVLIADGGRIDDMVTKFSKRKKYPAVCMGIGAQILVQSKTSHNNLPVVGLFDTDDTYALSLLKELSQHIQEPLSITPIDIKKKRSFFKSKFFEENKFIIFEKDKVKFNKFDLNQRKKLQFLIKQLDTKNKYTHQGT